MSFLCDYKIPFFRLSDAIQEKESLAQQSDLWRNKFKKIKEEKTTICEQAEKQKAAMSKKIQTLTEKCSRGERVIEVTMTT